MFVSPNGLIATNHHVASGFIERLSSKERDLLKNGFYAKTQAEELKVPDGNVSILESYENVTERVHKAAGSGTSDSDSAAKRTAEIAAIEKDCSAGLRCEVISFYSGGEYWLYRFKRYTDVRLVMAPEEQAAFFGGDLDNFVYPRHDLDFTFVRVYENDKPASTPNYLKWSATGAPEGEFIIASGYPGSTARLLTVSQLTYQREVGNPLQEKVWSTRRKALEDYSKRRAEAARQANPGMRSFANSLKRLNGQQNGLLNPRNFAKKEAEEKDLRDKLAAKPELNKQYAPAWDAIAKRMPISRQVESAWFFKPSIFKTSDHRTADRDVSHRSSENPTARVTRNIGTRLDAFRSALLSPAPIYPEMEESALTAWMTEARNVLGADDPFH